MHGLQTSLSSLGTAPDPLCISSTPQGTWHSQELSAALDLMLSTSAAHFGAQQRTHHINLLKDPAHATIAMAAIPQGTKACISLHTPTFCPVCQTTTQPHTPVGQCSNASTPAPHQSEGMLPCENPVIKLLHELREF